MSTPLSIRIIPWPPGALIPAQVKGPAAPPGEPALPCEALTRSEVRVLRYLPTNLSAPEIAAELAAALSNSPSSSVTRTLLPICAAVVSD
jgi:hypothetical protein